MSKVSWFQLSETHGILEGAHELSFLRLDFNGRGVKHVFLLDH